MTFQQTVEKHLKTLNLYVPVVDRVHGQHHPEFHEVRALWEQMNSRIAEAGNNKPRLGGAVFPPAGGEHELSGAGGCVRKL